VQAFTLCADCGTVHSPGHCLGLILLGGGNPIGITVEANQSAECLSIRQDNHDGTDDVVHICDWPSARATIDAFQAARTGGAA
jgi:hypothetical protein